MPVRQRYRLLVVDADRSNFAAIERIALPLGFEVEVFPVGAASLDMLLRRSPHVVLLDLNQQDGDGLDILRRFRGTLPGCPLVVMTATGRLEEAVEAIKEGARDYLTKPLDPARLAALLTEARDEVVRRTERGALSERAPAQSFAGMLGRSAVMLELFAAIQRLAPHSRIVLIGGETGTGKDLAARAFHQFGPRAARPFVRVHCSALDERTITDALGATLCLDEVADLDPAGQARLLRVLEDDELRRRRRPLGTAQDLAVIATTRRDLRAEVTAGRFRDDLLYRLNVVEIAMPPLRARREDIVPIATAVVREMAARVSRPLTGMTQAAERLLTAAPWPGNVRELRSVVERACLIATKPTISERELEMAMKPAPMATAMGAQGTEPGSSGGGDELERERILAVLEHVRGNRLAAAKILGISRRALYRRLERYQIGAEAPPRRAYLPRAR